MQPIAIFHRNEHSTNVGGKGTNYSFLGTQLYIKLYEQISVADYRAWRAQRYNKIQFYFGITLAIRQHHEQ
jgi:hypothetical protein